MLPFVHYTASGNSRPEQPDQFPVQSRRSMGSSSPHCGFPEPALRDIAQQIEG
jgi:hypothetical protein